MTSWLILFLAIAYVLIAIGAICFSLLKRSRRSASANLDEASEDSQRAKVGDLGVAYSPLDPRGKAWFGPSLLDVEARGTPVEAGSVVRIIAREGKRVVVEAE